MKIGLPGLLGLVFIILKLTGTIAWSWWWVLSPFWISFLIWVVLFAVIGAITGKALTSRR
jgi:hypothetical protein